MNVALEELAVGQQTYADYCQLPEGAPYQLIGGELIVTPSPPMYHEIVRSNIRFEAEQFVRKNKLGKLFCAPADVYLGEKEVYQPDIFFVTKGRFPIIEKNRLNGAPDWVVEILSPSTGYYDLRKKYRVYEERGVKEYWIVDPEEKVVQVFVLHEGKFLLDQEAREGEIVSRVLAGFSIPVADVFRD